MSLEKNDQKTMWNNFHAGLRDTQVLPGNAENLHEHQRHSTEILQGLFLRK